MKKGASSSGAAHNDDGHHISYHDEQDGFSSSEFRKQNFLEWGVRERTNRTAWADLAGFFRRGTLLRMVSTKFVDGNVPYVRFEKIIQKLYTRGGWEPHPRCQIYGPR